MDVKQDINYTDVTATQGVEFWVRRINELLAHYIPARNAWNPADESLYKPVDLYRVPLDEALDMQLKAIKYTFGHHYYYNEFYHKYCEMRNVHPDDIKTADDFEKIPLIPDTTYKGYPSGKDFAYWLATIFTGNLPEIVIKSSNPSYDDVINAFNAAGLAVMYSSGTSGRHTFIPRDMKTFKAAQYAVMKLRASMIDVNVDHAFLLFPNPTKTNLFIGRATSFTYDLFEDVHYAMDHAITTEITQRAMSGNQEQKREVVSTAQQERLQKVVDLTIQWLERYEKTEKSIRLSGPPFMFFLVMNTLQMDGKSFDFGDRGAVSTGGGWKIYEDKRISHADFRKQVENVLGIPERRCLDLYGMCEGNGWMWQCPEGHYLHAPYTYYTPLVLDDELMPMGYGEWGRFAFLDALAQSYPGFIVSGDRVRMLEHCPVCDRPGPVLEPEIKRAKGEEVRGCAEELRRILAQDIAR